MIKSIVKWLLAATVLAGMCACGKSKISEGVQIAVIPKGTTHEFWKAIHAGAIKAQQDLRLEGVDTKIVWKGPLREDDRDFQIMVVENFAGFGIDGIVLAPLDSTALVAPVELAMRSKVPVVIIDSDINTDNYVSFIATDNYKGGEIAAEHLAKLLLGRGNVVLLRYQVGSASTENREQGFLDTIAKFPEIKVISDSDYAGATVNAAYQKAETIVNDKRIGGQMDGVFCPNETVTIAMTKALKEAGMAGGKVKVVGFDSGPQSVIDLENGDLQALVVQDPMMMGYQGVRHVVLHLAGQKVERRVDTGVFLITKLNMYEPRNQQLLHPPIDKYLKP